MRTTSRKNVDRFVAMLGGGLIYIVVAAFTIGDAWHKLRKSISISSSSS